ncbi:CATRA conflict system CASPASE/TPR repeat-associated protein [Streptomyces aurantiogriseus]|uniref:CATRA conflict system CASPASE/TPR repeat-associated protein n=1 Tax=Streptomyces aurantiogriseus TaxID=66870 RepID=UPI0016764069|nr:CATRA conflict system CASPASE/TPR repeat-associated protein [Streptomyces aurantiogriseus]
MTGLVLHSRALLVLAVADPEDPRAVDAIRRLWENCERFAMRAPLTRRHLDASFPTREELAEEIARTRDGGTRLIRARERPRAPDAAKPSVYQAFLFVEHDVLVFSALLAPGEDETDSWADLDRRWSEHLGPVPSERLLGLHHVHTALADAVTSPSAGTRDEDGALASEEAATAAAALLARDIPGLRDGPWQRRWQRTAEGALVWHTDPGGRGRVPARDRRIAVLAATEAEGSLDEWLWQPADRYTPAPFVRYLVHAGKMRRQMAAYLEGRDIGELRHRLTAQCDQLAGLHRQFIEHESAALFEELLRSQALLKNLQVGETGLVRTLTLRRSALRTVEIALHSMEEAVALPAEVRPYSLFDADRRAGARFRRMVEDDSAYLSDLREQVSETVRITETTIVSRLHRREQRLALLQTAFLGALLMGLAAVQALSYRVPAPGYLQAPLIAFLSVLALALPLAASRVAAGRAAPPPVSGPLARVDTAVVLALGATSGWLLTTALRTVTASGPAPPWLSLTAASAAVMAIAAGGRYRRRSREARRRSAP